MPAKKATPAQVAEAAKEKFKNGNPSGIEDLAQMASKLTAISAVVLL